MVTLELPLTRDLIRRLEKKIYEEAGGSRNTSLVEKISAPLESAIQIVEKKIRPRTVGRVLRVLNSDKHTVTTDAGPITSAMFAYLVSRCDKEPRVVFMLATIGSELEKAAKTHRDLLDQWVFDRVGGELMEMVVNEAEGFLKEQLFNGKVQFGKRISPGYCDWALGGQQTVFKALDADKIGVTLSPHMVMMPQKSISGVIAAAETIRVKNPCSRCPNKECQWRRSD
jgi:hypothetical protein